MAFVQVLRYSALATISAMGSLATMAAGTARSHNRPFLMLAAFISIITGLIVQHVFAGGAHNDSSGVHRAGNATAGCLPRAVL